MVLLAISLDHPAKFFNWGFISISIPFHRTTKRKESEPDVNYVDNKTT
jgi:hypothetical protein